MNTHVENALRGWETSLERYGHIDSWSLNEKVNRIGEYIKSSEDTLTIRRLVSRVRDMVISASYESAVVIRMIKNVLQKVKKELVEKYEDVYKILPGQRVRFKGQTYKLFDEKLRFKEGKLLRNFDIEIETAKDSKKVRRIVEKRMSQAYYKMNCKRESGNRKDRNHRYWMKRATAFQLYNIGQVEHVKNVSRGISTHWKRMFDPITGEIVFKKKMSYNTYEEALNAINIWYRNRPEDKGSLQAYVCTICGKWHIGHYSAFANANYSCNEMDEYSLVC